MNQYNQKNKVNGLRTGLDLDRESEMDFYVPVGAIVIELKDCSDDTTGIESKNLACDETETNFSKDYALRQFMSNILGKGCFTIDSG